MAEPRRGASSLLVAHPQRRNFHNELFVGYQTIHCIATIFAKLFNRYNVCVTFLAFCFRPLACNMFDVVCSATPRVLTHPPTPTAFLRRMRANRLPERFYVRPVQLVNCLPSSSSAHCSHVAHPHSALRPTAVVVAFHS